MSRKILAVLLSVFMVVGVFPNVAFAEELVAGDFRVTGKSVKGCKYNNNVLSIESDGDYTISEIKETKENTIKIGASCKNVHLTLESLHIDVSDKPNRAAFEDKSSGQVKIDLEGYSILKSGENCAGLQKSGVGKWVINGANGSWLWVTGGENAAGIGGGNGGAGSNITINGGKVASWGGEDGAGIGGGNGGAGSNITINGGKIEARSGCYGAGIGGGEGGKGSNITINGGKIEARCLACHGAGIGGGQSGAGSNIKINGGSIEAKGGLDGAGIGGGKDGEGSNITIAGGEVKAEGNAFGAGIGGGENKSGNNITITGGSILAKSDGYAAGIGGGNCGAGNNIIISGGEVRARGGENGAGIGGGAICGSGEKIKITSEKGIEAIGGEFAAGVGGGENGNGSDITVSTKKFNAIGGKDAPAIGGGKGGRGERIVYGGKQYNETVRELMNVRLSEADKNFINQINKDVSSSFVKRVKIDPKSEKINGNLKVPQGAKIEDYSKNDDFANDGEKLAMKNVNGEKLFPNVPNVCDVLQYDVGNCYFLSSLAAVAEKDPQIIQDSIVDNKNGTVTIRFFNISNEDKEPIACYYKIKKTVPEKYYKKDCIWVKLFEKAYVLHLKNTRRKDSKLVRDYEIIKSGSTCNALREIVPGIKIYDYMVYLEGEYKFSDYSSGNVMNKYISEEEVGDISYDGIVCAGSRDDCKVDGIVPGHAYTVLGVGIEAGKKFLKLRNPHGENIPTYGDSLGKVEPRKSEEKREGIFKLRMEEFRKAFNIITVGILNPLVRAVAPKPAAKKVNPNPVREQNIGSWKVTGDSSGYEYDKKDNVLRIKSGGNYYIKGNGKVTNTTIEISEGCGAVNLTLNGVKIDVTKCPNKAALVTKSNNPVNINIEGENSLLSGENCAGLQKDGKGKLTIIGKDNKKDKLTAVGGYHAAGIGGGDRQDVEHIEISGCHIIAKGGAVKKVQRKDAKGKPMVDAKGNPVMSTWGLESTGGAGIGAGNCGNADDIVISDAIVEATGGHWAAGVGSGREKESGDIIIRKSEVKATGGFRAAGIGTGRGGRCAGSIEISDSKVIATGMGKNASGIGHGDDGKTADSAKLTVSNSDITAEAAKGESAGGKLVAGGLGISYKVNKNSKSKLTRIDYLEMGKVTGDSSGCEYNKKDNVLKIKSGGNYRIEGNGKVTDTTIEISEGCEAVNLTLNGVKIDVTKCPNKVALVTKSNNPVNINIEGENSLLSGENCAGLQKDGKGKLTIMGKDNKKDKLTAVGGYHAAGIGGGDRRDVEHIEISGCHIIAKGGAVKKVQRKDTKGNTIVSTWDPESTGGAGIGAGNYGSANDIVISSAIVEVIGGHWAAGIGAGREKESGNIIIRKSEVKATGGFRAAGIGTGRGGRCAGSIEISDSKVIATGMGKNASGIGHGDDGKTVDSARLTISNSDITAEAAKGETVNGKFVSGGLGVSCRIGGASNSKLMQIYH